MKYCSKCGRELIDEAVICTGCGCMVKSMAFEKNSQKKHEKEKQSEDMIDSKPIDLGALPVINFIFSLFVILCLLFTLLSIVYTQVYVEAALNDYYYDGVSQSGWCTVDPVLSCFAMIFAIGAAITGILGFVMTFFRQLKKEYLFSAITKGVLGFGLFLTTFIAFCSCF